jgi:hypothetical protein
LKNGIELQPGFDEAFQALSLFRAFTLIEVSEEFTKSYFTE